MLTFIQDHHSLTLNKDLVMHHLMEKVLIFLLSVIGNPHVDGFVLGF